MKTLRYCLLLSIFLANFTSANLPIADSQNQPLPTLAPLLKKITPAVVNISVTANAQMANPLLNDPFFRHFFNIPDNYQPQTQKPAASGSGVIIDAKKGIVITNHHVIAQAKDIIVSLNDGKEYTAKLVGSDPAVDIAILSINPDENLAELPIANSDKLNVGDFVIAIGNPFGLGQTVTTGIISALERNGLGDEYEGYIQTDAAINPGNSGGALVNLRGELIGINKAIIAPSGGNVGIGFAIPSNMASNSMNQIIEYGEVKRAQLGVFIQDLTPQLAEAFNLSKVQKGVLITEVIPNSAADKSGLKSEDIITAINGKETNNTYELRNNIAMQRVGDSIDVEIIRNAKKHNVNVQLGSKKQAIKTKNKAQQKSKELIGATIISNQDGIMIQSIKPQSLAEKVGLMPSDYIIAINQQPIKQLTDLNSLDNVQRFLFKIKRQQTLLYIVARR